MLGGRFEFGVLHYWTEQHCHTGTFHHPPGPHLSGWDRPEGTAFLVFTTVLSIHSFVPTKIERLALQATQKPAVLRRDRQTRELL